MATFLESLIYSAQVSANSANLPIYRHQAITSRVIAGVTYQALCYFNNQDNLVVAYRELPFGTWVYYLYDDTIDSPSLSNTGTDSHDVGVLEIDADGYLHIAYSMHGDPLNYRKSDSLISSWTGGLTAGLSMLGTNESQVSYPAFFRSPTGTLYFMFRDGVSGAGDLYFYEYDESSESWSAANGTGANGLLVQGNTGSTTYSPYLFGVPCFSSDWDGSGTGYMHFAWTMRRTENLTNNDVYHARWDGTGFTDITGSSQTTPITISNAYAALGVAESEELINQSGMCLDANNRPHISLMFSDGSYHQIYDLYYNGSSWVEQQITSYSSVYDTSDCGRPYIFCDADFDIIYILFTHTLESDGIIQYESDQGDFSSWTKSTFYSAYLGTYEPQMDLWQWNREREISLYVQRGKSISSENESPRVLSRAPKNYDTDFGSNEWGRKHSITIDKTKVGAGGVADYTVLLTRGNFDHEVCDPSGSYAAQEDGGDLRFFSDEALTTQLACHVISFGHDSSSGAGDAEVEVRVGPISLSDGADTIIYAAYGTSNHKHQPFIDEPYGVQAAYDSYWRYNSPFAYTHWGNLISQDDPFFRSYYYAPSPAPGAILDGVEFTGQEFVSLGAREMGIATGFALVAYVSVGSLSSVGQILCCDNNDRVVHFKVLSDGLIRFVRFNSSDNVVTAISGITDIQNAGFKRVVAEFDTSEGSEIFIDAVSEITDADTTQNNDNGADPWYVSYRQGGDTDFLDGILDQIEIHTAKRGQAWWTTDFNNLDSPPTFATAGSPSSLSTTTTTSATTTAATTASPTTLAPTTSAPTTAEPTTVAPTTLAPTTVEPTTLAPTTLEPTTLAPTTEEPTTAAPTTVAPTTSAPTTEEPTTPAPTTLAPTTSEPTTSAPTTTEPTTVSPTTIAPTTTAPTTAEPTTVSPTTLEPTTSAPTTAEPTTAEPTTSAPTTAEPTTSAPTTSAPTTEAPTTIAPTSLAPTTTLTTPAPTTAPPITFCVKDLNSIIVEEVNLSSIIIKELDLNGNLCR